MISRNLGRIEASLSQDSVMCAKYSGGTSSGTSGRRLSRSTATAIAAGLQARDISKW